jgi:hypothetical protein
MLLDTIVHGSSAAALLAAAAGSADIILSILCEGPNMVQWVLHWVEAHTMSPA